MSRTLARLIGFEGELVRELMLNDCPPRVMVPEISRIKWTNCDELDTDVRVYVACYEREFAVEGDPILATYRRRLEYKQTKEPRS